jgi:hypothetical protein
MLMASRIPRGGRSREAGKEQIMSEETEGARGAAAWQEQRAAIAKRNADARKRGQAERKTREGAAEARDRVRAAREVKELDALNAQIADDASRR